MKKLNAKQEAKFLEKLLKQEDELSVDQFQILCKIEPPAGVTFDAHMARWIAINEAKKAKKAMQDNLVKEAILKLSDAVQKQIEQEEIKQKWKLEYASNVIQMPMPAHAKPKQEKKPKWKLPTFKWLTVAVACVLCLAIVIPNVLSGNDDNGKYFGASDVRAVVLNFEETHANMVANPNKLMFHNVLHVFQALREVYRHDEDITLSYVFNRMLVNASPEDMSVAVLFDIDFRIRIDNNYIFSYYNHFAVLPNVGNILNVGNTEVRYLTRAEISLSLAGIEIGEGVTVTSSSDPEVFMRFTWGTYEYFLRVSPIYLDGFGYATPLEHDYLVLLMQNLIPH